MNTSRAVLVDHIIGYPLCIFLNVLACLLGLLLRRNHSGPYSPKRILFIKLMGAGTIIQALPLIDGVAREFPGAEIRMMCFPETRGLAERLPMVLRIHTIDRRSVFTLARDTFREVCRLWSWHPDLVFDLEYHSKFTTIISTATCALNRAGLFDFTTRFRTHLYTHLMYANPHQHISDLYMQLGRIFGVNGYRSLAECGMLLDITPAERREMRGLLDSLGLAQGSPWCVVNPNAGDLCHERRWPRESFAQLCVALSTCVPVFLVGAPPEHEYTESVMGMMDGGRADNVHNVAGRLSFGAYLALLQGAALVVTSDSGPMHFSAALGAPTVSLWGPEHPSRFQPRTKDFAALTAGVFCSPCIHITSSPPCGGNNICMKSILVADVMEAARSLAPDLPIPGRMEVREPFTRNGSVIAGFVVRDWVASQFGPRP